MQNFTLVDKQTYEFRHVDLLNLSPSEEEAYVVLTNDYDAAAQVFGTTIANVFYTASFLNKKIAYDTMKKKINKDKEIIPNYHRDDWFIYLDNVFVGTMALRTSDHVLKDKPNVLELSASIKSEFRSKRIVSGLFPLFIQKFKQEHPDTSIMIRTIQSNEVVCHLVKKNNFKFVDVAKTTFDLILLAPDIDFMIWVLD